MKAIIFDFGGVLVRTKTWAPRHKWDDILGFKHGTIEHLVFNSERGKATQCGEYTEEAHWAYVGRHLNLTAEQLAEFRHDFWAGDEVDTRLIDFIRSLQAKYQIAIISNFMDGLRQDLADKWCIADAFDTIVVSAEHGVMKPAASIYEHCLALLGVAAEDAVFIDDFAHNIAGAHAVGMHGIHYPPTKDTDDLIREFAEMGVAP